MTQPATNAQVALQAATQCHAAWLRSDRPYAWQPDIMAQATAYLAWLDAHTLPIPDQSGELG